jgi:hypothetical protein
MDLVPIDLVCMSIFLGRNTVLEDIIITNSTLMVNFSSPSLFSTNVGAPIFKNGIVKSLFYKQQQSKLSIYEYS